MIHNCFAHFLTGKERNEADAVADGGKSDTLSAIACDAREHGVAPCSSRLREILHEHEEDEATEEATYKDLERKVANAQKGDDDDEHTDACGDDSLLGLQAQMECLNLARSVLHNTGNLTKVCIKALYTCQHMLRDAKRQKLT